MKLVLEDVGVTPEVEELVPEAVAPVLNDASLFSKLWNSTRALSRRPEACSRRRGRYSAGFCRPFASWFTQADLQNQTTPCKTSLPFLRQHTKIKCQTFCKSELRFCVDAVRFISMLLRRMFMHPLCFNVAPSGHISMLFHLAEKVMGSAPRPAPPTPHGS